MLFNKQKPISKNCIGLYFYVPLTEENQDGVVCCEHVLSSSYPQACYYL